jgi:hypothetical protein
LRPTLRTDSRDRLIEAIGDDDHVEDLVTIQSEVPVVDREDTEIEGWDRHRWAAQVCFNRSLHIPEIGLAQAIRKLVSQPSLDGKPDQVVPERDYQGAG